MKALVLALVLAADASGADGGTDAPRQWEIRPLKAGQPAPGDLYCVDGTTLRGMAGEKRHLVETRREAEAEASRAPLYFALGVGLGVVAGGAVAALVLPRR